LPLPEFTGMPIRVDLSRSLGPHLAATHIPSRRILLDRAVLGQEGDFERILVHEIFHFVWVRLGNAKRRSWEVLLEKEFAAKTAGELGYSAEWRKNKLTLADIGSRAPGWRRYSCESFCDTAAWLYSALRSHEEFTLGRTARARRRGWFREYIRGRQVSI
jgi:hypothetical protein